MFDRSTAAHCLDLTRPPCTTKNHPLGYSLVFSVVAGSYNASIGLKMEESGDPENIFSNISADFSENKGYVKYIYSLKKN